MQPYAYLKYIFFLKFIVFFSAQLEKLEGLCRKFVVAALNDDSLNECQKLGAWQARANHLLDDLVAMKNVCIKMNDEAESTEGGEYAGGAGNGDGGNGGYQKPTDAPKPVKPVKPSGGGYKKPASTPKPNKPNRKPSY